MFGDAVPNLERAETLTPLHVGVERVGSTMVSGDIGAEKLLLVHKDMSDGSRVLSNTTLGEPTLDTSGQVNPDHDVKLV